MAKAISSDRIQLTSGDKTVVFVKTDKGWGPDWFYQGDRRMLRFKDHEWLSIGHLGPAWAAEAKAGRTAAVFSGQVIYGKTPVAWDVKVSVDRLSGGFAVETAFRPEKPIELMEAFTSFETPYEYDGTEHVTTVIGQNPVTQWKGAQRVSPEQWRHPFWSYNRPECVHMTGSCNTPLICQEVKNADGSEARYLTLVGDWSVCKAQDVFVTPTRTVDSASGDWGENKKACLRGYKYILGGVNWSSALAQDPNVLYKAGVRQRQRVFVTYSGTAPGGSFDRQLMAAWERAAACDLPASGRVAAYEFALKRGVTWETASAWLKDVFGSDQATEGLFDPEKGIATYAPGTRPKAGGYGWLWWPQWAGHLHYQALVKGDARLADRCETLDGKFAAFTEGRAYGMMEAPIVSITSLPSLWWIAGAGRDGALARALRSSVETTWKRSADENGGQRKADYGSQATRAEALLLAAAAYGEGKYADQALVLLGELNERLDGNFWEFGCTDWSDTMHGGQARPMGYGHAITANLLAWKRTGRVEFRAAARRFARLLVSVHYMTHNGSLTPDMDFRGWANGTVGGRDQHAEMPPWETSNALLSLCAMMATDDLEAGCHDAVWYFARTGLCQFPAARAFKRVWDPALRKASYVPRSQVASEAEYYDVLPYLAYENPHDQTLLASYQGTDCLNGELVYGGGLARAADDRITAIVPRAAMMDPQEQASRQVLLWNPTARPITTEVTATWPDGRTTARETVVPPRQIVRVELEPSP